jgi:Spherulation-specific family 4
MLDNIDIGSNRTRLCAIIHSVPDNIQGSALRDLVKQVRQFAEGVFITHLSSDYYASFDAGWAEFVKLMGVS